VTIEAAPHRPVLLDEVLDALRPSGEGCWVDATVGAGGHAESILERSAPLGRVIGIDRDPAALEISARRLERFGDRFVPVRGRYEDFVELVRGAGAFAVDGVVADLGVSSMQLDDPGRGFSFRADGPLDMRMDPQTGESAADLLAHVSEVELARILAVYGEERRARAIARAIVRRREQAPITRTADLAGIVADALGPGAARFRIHPATRSFQALRIAVNAEIVGIERFVTDAVSMLRRGARIAVIAFHSLEDRAVKLTLRGLANRCVCPPGLPVCGCGRENIVRLVTTKAVRPDADEVRDNPRSRSARLRVAERTG